jgi:hypothetical protein
VPTTPAAPRGSAPAIAANLLGALVEHLLPLPFARRGVLGLGRVRGLDDASPNADPIERASPPALQRLCMLPPAVQTPITELAGPCRERRGTPASRSTTGRAVARSAARASHHRVDFAHLFNTRRWRWRLRSEQTVREGDN